MNGYDGSWGVLYGEMPLTESTIDLAVDEDQIGDYERWHTVEQVACFVFESSFTISGPLPTTIPKP